MMQLADERSPVWPLRTLEREEQEHEMKMIVLPTALDASLASGIAERDPVARVRQSLRLPKTKS